MRTLSWDIVTVEITLPYNFIDSSGIRSLFNLNFRRIFENDYWEEEVQYNED